MSDMFSNFEMFDKLSDKFFLRLLIDVISMIILVRFIYFRIYRKKDYLFTFFLFNIIIFIITYLFIVIAMGLITAVSKGTYFELCVIDFILIAFTYALDGNWLVRNEMAK